MIKWFNDEADNAKAGAKSAVRAHQAWQYLIAKAANRQIIQYGRLRDLMEYRSVNPLISALDCIMHYCEQNGLPSLTVIVVNKKGSPGEGFSAVPPPEIPQEREKVFQFPWYKLVPPGIEDLKAARERQKKEP